MLIRMLGLMRTSTHRQIYTRQGEAYRREIEQARSETRKTKQELERWVEIFTPKLVTTVGAERPIGQDRYQATTNVDRSVLDRI